MDRVPRWYGMFVPGRDLALLDDVTRPLVARPSVGAYFVKLNSEFTTQMLVNFDARGLMPFLTLEPWYWNSKPLEITPTFSLAALLNGDHDEHLERIAAQIAAFNKPVLLRFGHEMNGHWYPWAVGVNGNTAEQYVQVWRKVRRMFSVAPKIRWVWACAAINSLRTSAPDVATCWPGDEWVDYAGTTGYGWNKDAYETYNKTFAKLGQFTGRPYLIPEMGAENGVNKAGTPAATWTRSLVPYLRDNPRIHGFVWFHIGPEQAATGDYRLRDRGVIDALNRVLRDVPVTSNTAMRSPAGKLYPPTTPARAVNPSSGTVAQNVIRGHACDSRGPRFGFDKRGVQYECRTDPRGWSNWQPMSE